MPKYEEQDCPLCETKKTRFCYTHHKLAKHFHCKICKEFQLGELRSDLIANCSEIWKKEASEESRNSSDDKILVISLVNVSSLKPGEPPYLVKSLCDRAKIQQCT